MSEEKRQFRLTPTDDMRAIKRAAKEQFGHVMGVKGFGIGDHALRIYVSSVDIGKRLPTSFRGVRVDYVVTGDIVARR